MLPVAVWSSVPLARIRPPSCQVWDATANLFRFKLYSHCLALGKCMKHCFRRYFIRRIGNFGTVNRLILHGRMADGDQFANASKVPSGWSLVIRE